MKALVLLLLATTAVAGPLDETRYCGLPKRDAAGQIVRSSAVVAAFRRIHPCPSTGLRTGPCEGWQADHTWPLACGGCDSVSNLSWMPTVLKAGPGTLPKDRWERRIYCQPLQITPMPTLPYRLQLAP